MTPNEIRATRAKLGLTLTDMASMLGYEGEQIRSQMHKLETGERPLRLCQERLLRAYLAGYRPPDWPVDLGKSPTRADVEAEAKHLKPYLRPDRR